MMLDIIFESKTIKQMLKRFNEVYTEEGVDSLTDMFSGLSPSIREVSAAAIDYCDAWNSIFDDNVYLLTAPNGKQYAGQTNKIKKRFDDYRRNGGSNEHFTRALIKYGFEKFEIESYTIPTACADIIEKFMILWNDLTNSYKGYNKTSGGKNGWMMTDETRTKIRASKLGIPRSVEAKAELKASWTPRRKAAQSMARSGINHPNFGKKFPEISAKMSGENNPKFGKKDSKETKEKKRIGRLGKKASDDTRAKQRTAKLGKKQSEETCFKKRGNANRATPVIVHGILFESSKYARNKEFPDKNEKYVSEFIRKHSNSPDLFLVSKEFYANCQENSITENITRKMYELFNQERGL
jgi:group I intron endonuclease